MLRTMLGDLKNFRWGLAAATLAAFAALLAMGLLIVAALDALIVATGIAAGWFVVALFAAAGLVLWGHSARRRSEFNLRRF